MLRLEGRQISCYEDLIMNLPDNILYPILAKRLNIRPSPSNVAQYHLENDERNYWTLEYLREKLFDEMASKKVIITYRGKDITIHKYFNQASRVCRWIPIARPSPEFVINISDLSMRTVLELKCLHRIDYNYVTRRAVCQIFEYIDPLTYRASLAKNLRVRLDR